MRFLLASQLRVRFIAAVGLAAALLFLALLSHDATGTLSGGHTDHVAHIGETRAVTVVGLQLWKEPAATLFRRLTRSEQEALPPDLRRYAKEHAPDVHHVASFAPDRPLVMNFAHLPRCYPPGVFLVSMPSALLLHFGIVSFSGANRLFLALLAVAWFASVLAWTAHWRQSDANHEHSRSSSALRDLMVLVVAGYVWYWAMEGFYDVAAMTLASWANVLAQRHDRWGTSALLWGLAVFVHPRMLALLPLAALPFLGTLKHWRLQTITARTLWLLGAALFAGALLFAWAIQATVALHAASQPELKNVLRPGGGGPLLVVIAYATMLVALAFLLFKQAQSNPSQGARADAIVVLFMGFAFATQRYLTSWYWLLALPWALTAPLPERSFWAPRAITDRGAASTPSAPWLSYPQVAARALMTLTFYVASQAAKW